MKVVIPIGFALLFLIALFLMSTGHWLWARVFGFSSLIPFLFGLWKRKGRVLPTITLCALFIVYIWVSFWLYPTGVRKIRGTLVNKYDTVIALLTIPIVVLSLLEVYRDSQRKRKRGSAETPNSAHSRQ